MVNAKDNHVSNSLNEWLCNVYLSDELQVDDHREVMSYGDMLIFKNGDIYGKTYQIIRSKNGANVNVLARKKQLDELSSNLPLIKKSFEFLLERESNESILREFNLETIETYFPEYPLFIKKNFN